MTLPTEPLPLHHSWPLFEAADRLHLEKLLPFAGQELPAPEDIRTMEEALARRGIGVWQCDLRTERLSWTAGVHDLFGLPRGMEVSRPLAVSFYVARSRPAMEALRAHAIRHRRGFTVDTEIRRPDGAHRWMRLSAVPVLDGRKVVLLRGLKLDVTREYDSPGRCGGETDGLPDRFILPRLLPGREGSPSSR